MVVCKIFRLTYILELPTKKQKAPLRVHNNIRQPQQYLQPTKKHTRNRMCINNHISLAFNVLQAIHMTSDKYKCSYRSPPLAEFVIVLLLQYTVFPDVCQ